MTAINITGIKPETLFESTRKALEIFNGSAVKKDSRVRSFLSAQLALRNEHQYPLLFKGNSSQNNVVKPAVSRDTISDLFSAIESSTEDLSDEIRVYQNLLAQCLANSTREALKKDLNEALYILDDENTFTESTDMLDFYHSLPGKICRDCSTTMTSDFCSTKTCRYNHYTQDVDLDLVNYKPTMIPLEQQRQSVEMQVETDDGEVSINIDVSAFFYHAIQSNNDIKACVKELNEQGLSCCIAVDTIFEWMTDFNTDADALLSYCHTLNAQGKNMGYQATIDESELKRFLSVNAPDLSLG